MGCQWRKRNEWTQLTYEAQNRSGQGGRVNSLRGKSKYSKIPWPYTVPTGLPLPCVRPHRVSCLSCSNADSSLGDGDFWLRTGGTEQSCKLWTMKTLCQPTKYPFPFNHFVLGGRGDLLKATVFKSLAECFPCLINGSLLMFQFN